VGYPEPIAPTGLEEGKTVNKYQLYVRMPLCEDKILCITIKVDNTSVHTCTLKKKPIVFFQYSEKNKYVFTRIRVYAYRIKSIWH
jgi:hypothetical protein